MFRLRYEVFHERLGWKVNTHDRMEIDQFDELERAHYILARSPQQGVDACWRILPTLGPNMLRDVFPELLHGQPAPAAADVWELSRFALATDRLNGTENAGNPQIAMTGGRSNGKARSSPNASRAARRRLAGLCGTVVCWRYFDARHRIAAQAARTYQTGFPRVSGIRPVADYLSSTAPWRLAPLIQSACSCPGTNSPIAALLILHTGLALRAGAHRPLWVFSREPRRGDVPGSDWRVR